MKNFLEEAKKMQEELVAFRRKIHQNPEIGEHLPQTKKFVREKLVQMGYQPQELGDSGLAALAGDPGSGRCILLRADMDALPMREETELPFRSENGNMHSCGHDMHTAMLLGAASLLKSHESELPGCVKLMFQPAEETFTGAQMMIREGILENPKVDAAITMHGDGMSEYDAGKMTMITKGVAMASCDSYRIEIEGIGTHGAFPNQGVDPIMAGMNIYNALQEIITREIKASDVAVLTQGTFHAGTAANIIPDTAYMEGTLRTFDKEVRMYIRQRVEEITMSVAAAFRVKARCIWNGGCQPLYNDPEVFEDVSGYIRELLGQEGLVIEGEEAVPFSSEDFSNILDLVPGIQMFLVTGSMKAGADVPMHNPKIVFDESVMYIGAAVLAYVASRWLEEHCR